MQQRSRSSAVIHVRERARRMAATRRWRQRVRAGEAVYPVLGDAEILDLLVRTHWLDERDACDRAEVGMAIAALLAMMGG